LKFDHLTETVYKEGLPRWL